MLSQLMTVMSKQDTLEGSTRRKGKGKEEDTIPVTSLMDDSLIYNLIALSLHMCSLHLSSITTMVVQYGPGWQGLEAGAGFK